MINLKTVSLGLIASSLGILALTTEAQAYRAPRKIERFDKKQSGRGQKGFILESQVTRRRRKW